MNINDFKDLERLMKLARRMGVDSMSVGGVTFQLGADPKRVAKEEKVRQRTATLPDYSADIPEASISVPTFIGMPKPPKEVGGELVELTQEQLLNWSVQQEAASE